MKPTKPQNCQCDFPDVVYKSLPDYDSQHANECPVYKEYLKRLSPKKVIIILIHDRHTDDKIRVLDYSEESIEKAKTICKNAFSDSYNEFALEDNFEGDWCWFIGEDYFAYYVVKEIE